MKRAFLFILALFFLTGCSSPSKTPETQNQWWNTAVFYEIFIRSFADSNGDGIGDFNGLTQRLDYLNDGKPGEGNDLEVDALWLMPIMPSSSYHGYDVTDYYSVNPDYGTMEDFRRLLDEAHRRNIKVIIDLVINHTSWDHPWFQDSWTPSSPKRDWYIWSETDPGYSGPWSQVVWHRGPKEGFYYGVFYHGMPDLNLENPEVKKEIQKIVKFWLVDVGVDGFRLDGVRHYIEDGKKQVNTRQTHEWLKKFYADVKKIKPDAVLVGEVWDGSDLVAPYLNSSELDLAFDFDLAEAWVGSVSSGDARGIASVLGYDSRLVNPFSFATFLTNHDMNRVMSQVGGNLQKAKLASMLLLTSPGTPFLYYGEEIGLMGAKPDENIRLPMRWDDGQAYGFTGGIPWREDPSEKPEPVSRQINNKDSLLEHYRKWIAFRKNNPALLRGKTYVLDSVSPSLIGYLRVDGDQVILILANPGMKQLENARVSLSQSDLRGTIPLVCAEGCGSTHFTLQFDPNGGFTDLNLPFVIPADGWAILQATKK